MKKTPLAPWARLRKINLPTAKRRLAIECQLNLTYATIYALINFEFFKFIDQGLLEMRLRLPTFYLGSLKGSKNIFLGSSRDWQQINEKTGKSFSFVSIVAF